MKTAARVWRGGQAGWPRRFPVVQLPNAPLMAALAGRGLASRTAGSPRDAGRAVFLVGLVVWAGEEALAGANWFRRLLGVGALAWLGITRGGQGDPR